MKRIPLQQLLDLTGKAAIVTGGARGIGLAISHRLAEAGAHVMIADIDGPEAQKAAQALQANGWTVEAITCDVSQESDVKRMVQTCQETFGSVSILINNAGIFPPAPIADMTVDEFDKVMAVNTRSVFMATKYAAEMMKSEGGGKIINITSIDALRPSLVGLAHYDASKHGVWGFTKNAALELAPHNIWVNAVAPGGIQTPGVEAMQPDGQPNTSIETFMARIPMHRMGEPDEIGKVVLFLASDMSSYMTGEQIVVDGGALLI
jgi:2-deoxy-D-gluconate 3-dehydrogenase